MGSREDDDDDGTVFATLAAAAAAVARLEVYASSESKRALGSDDNEELVAPIDIMAGMCGVEPASADDSDRAGGVIVGGEHPTSRFSVEP